MKVSEDKLLDYLDGLLNKEESQAIALAIETDIETANEFNALKAGKELAETAHIYDVMTAPDPSQELKRDKNLSSQEKSWFSWIKFTPNMIPALSACMVVAFIGGLQFKNIANLYMPEPEEEYVAEINNISEKTIEKEKELALLQLELEAEIEHLREERKILSSDDIQFSIIEEKEFEIATNFVTLENTLRSPVSNKEFEQWSIVNNIAVNIRSRNKNQPEWQNVTQGQDVNKGEELEINIQSIKKQYISVDIQIKNEKDSTKLIKDFLLTPGNLIKKSFIVPSDKEELKIIFYSREENKETFEKIGTFTFNRNIL